MLKKVLLGIGGLIFIVLIMASFQPDEFQVQRSIEVSALPRKVFAHVNDFHAWAEWSPWEKMDPQMTKTFSGSASGEGSVYAWSGNSKVGEGSMTILKSQIPNLIVIQLSFLKPMKALNFCSFSFETLGSQTKVTWAMTGHNNYLAKVMHLFMNMDKMVGPDFEKGLSQLKTVVEAQK